MGSKVFRWNLDSLTFQVNSHVLREIRCSCLTTCMWHSKRRITPEQCSTPNLAVHVTHCVRFNCTCPRRQSIGVVDRVWSVLQFAQGMDGRHAVGTARIADGTCLTLLPRRDGGEDVPMAESMPTIAAGIGLPVPMGCLLVWSKRVLCRRLQYLAVCTEDGRRHLVCCL
jgi:hypothetical protein